MRKIKHSNIFLRGIRRIWILITIRMIYIQFQITVQIKYINTKLFSLSFLLLSMKHDLILFLVSFLSLLLVDILVILLLKKMF